LTKDPQIQEIKDKLNIYEVASKYITSFKKSGNNYFALCPFHNEKTPSFTVNPELGLFKCFGCGESGDVLAFIQKIENVDFPKALEIAASYAGVELKRNFSPEMQKIVDQKEKIIKINSLASEFFNFILTKHKKGETGKEYAKKRSLTTKQIKDFKIGYAPNSYTSLKNFLMKKGYKENDLVNWGLIVKKDRGTYDKFRARLIFPLFDHHGDIVGFSGRTIFKSDKIPKYLHSPTTLVFDKSKYLFGLYQAKNSIRKLDFVIFCEGQLDCVTASKTKYPNVVASLGTSFSNEQLQLINRYTKNIYFCFDNDLAGEKALIKAVDQASLLEFHIKVITLKKGKDIDELINLDEKEWEKSVENAEYIIPHLIKRLGKRLDMKTFEAKEEFLNIILPVLNNLPNEIEKEEYIQQIAMIIETDPRAVKIELKKVKSDKKNNTFAQVLLKNPMLKKEQYILAIFLQNTNISKDLTEELHLEYFQNELLFNIGKAFVKISEEKNFDLKNLFKYLGIREQKMVADLTLIPIRTKFLLQKELKREVRKVTKSLEKNYYKKEIMKLKSELKKAELSEDIAELKKLMQNLKDLTSKMS